MYPSFGATVVIRVALESCDGHAARFHVKPMEGFETSTR